MRRIHTVVLTLLALVVVGVAASSLPAVAPASGGDSGTSDTSPNAGGGSGGERAEPPASGLISRFTLDQAGEEREPGEDSRGALGRLAVGAALLLAGCIPILWRLTGGDSDEDDATTVDHPPAHPESAAGSRPQREHPPPANGVEQAWAALTERVGGEQPGESPVELASRAAEIGFDERAVTDLTNVFREVRYGDEHPTDRQEERARAALERVGRNENDGATER